MLISLTSYILISLKLVLLSILFLYLIFSVIVVGKVRFLGKILATDVSPLLSVLVGANLMASLALLLLALIIL
jgi:hypothetical protein